MAIDQPIVVYPKVEKTGEKRHTKEEMDALYDRWAEKKKREGSVVGKTFTIDDYLNNRV